MEKISTKKQRAIAKRAHDRIEGARAALAADGHREVYREFLEKFALCEIGYKSLLADYLKARGEATPENDLEIRTRQVPAVMRYAGIDVEPDVVTEVFDASRAKNKRHARGLRNSLAHAPNEEALKELSEKKDALYEAMDAFEESIARASEKSAA